ncbi:MAG: hypothetical protein E7178_06935 [Erysipelotrichaceae bacterium]|nr:hypothetical protein [Erysipelotrichaceae bacterium]
MKKALIIICNAFSIYLIFLGLTFLFETHIVVLSNFYYTRFVLYSETPLFIGMIFRVISFLLFDRIDNNEKNKFALASMALNIFLIILFALVGIIGLYQHQNNPNALIYVAGIIICILIELISGLTTYYKNLICRSRFIQYFLFIPLLAFSILIPIFGAMNNYLFDNTFVKSIGLCAISIIVIVLFMDRPNTLFVLVIFALFTVASIFLFIYSFAEYAIPFAFNAFVCLALISKKSIKKKL